MIIKGEIGGDQIPTLKKSAMECAFIAVAAAKGCGEILERDVVVEKFLGARTGTKHAVLRWRFQSSKRILGGSDLRERKRGERVNKSGPSKTRLGRLG